MLEGETERTLRRSRREQRKKNWFCCWDHVSEWDGGSGDWGRSGNWKSRGAFVDAELSQGERFQKLPVII